MRASRSNASEERNEVSVVTPRLWVWPNIRPPAARTLSM